MNILKHERVTELGALRNASLLVAGVGALGGTVSGVLVRLKVGKLYLVDIGVIKEPDLKKGIYSSCMEG